MTNVDLVYQERAEKLAKLLQEKGIGCFLFTTSVNMYYFTGFMEEQRPRFISLLIPSAGDPIFFVPELYGKQLRERSWIKEIITWADGEDPFDKLVALFREKGLDQGNFAVDDALWSSFLLKLQEKLPQAHFTGGGEYMKIFRRIKSAHEKELMLQIGALTDQVMRKAISAVGEGVSESHVAGVIDHTFRELGAAPSGNVPVVGSGAWSAQPHYTATDKVIRKGDSVVLDFVGIWQRYRSDITRTVFVGKPDPEYIKIYDTVKKAQETAMRAVKPGRSCEAIDRVARGIIDEAGYGKYFIHRTGHGIGLDTHEEPYLVEGNKLILEPGMTFSIEPGIYLPGRYGVRIEDCVIVTEDGCVPFTKFPHELICL